ncbi:unnamed protein product [Ectocarpus sp. 8 AP-2014]
MRSRSAKHTAAASTWGNREERSCSVSTFAASGTQLRLTNHKNGELQRKSAR